MQVFGFPPWLRLWVAGPNSIKGGSFRIFFDGTSPLMYMFILFLFSRSVVSGSLHPMYYSTPGFPVLHYLPEFAKIHIH